MAGGQRKNSKEATMAEEELERSDQEIKEGSRDGSYRARRPL